MPPSGGVRGSSRSAWAVLMRSRAIFWNLCGLTSFTRSMETEVELESLVPPNVFRQTDRRVEGPKAVKSRVRATHSLPIPGSRPVGPSRSVRRSPPVRPPAAPISFEATPSFDRVEIRSNRDLQSRRDEKARRERSPESVWADSGGFVKVRPACRRAPHPIEPAPRPEHPVITRTQGWGIAHEDDDRRGGRRRQLARDQPPRPRSSGGRPRAPARTRAGRPERHPGQPRHQADRGMSPGPTARCCPTTPRSPPPAACPRTQAGRSRCPTGPIEPYMLTKENGPFMVLAHSFRGPDAPRQALALAMELREKYTCRPISSCPRSSPARATSGASPPRPRRSPRGTTSACPS